MPRALPLGLTVRHYAGAVTYTASGFCEKNKDILQPALVALCTQQSTSPFVRALFKDAEGDAPIGGGGGGGGPRRLQRRGSTMFFKSVTSQARSARTQSPSAPPRLASPRLGAVRTVGAVTTGSVPCKQRPRL